MRTVNIEKDVIFDRVEAALGAAEWAAIQTVHLADSLAFRWLCETNAIADQNARNIHSHAIRFDHDRIMDAL
jgi:methyl coenzyme M reductase gamma subunit